jgi:hypothetical protein
MSATVSQSTRQVLKVRQGQRVIRRGFHVWKISRSYEDLENQFRWFGYFAGFEGVPQAVSLERRAGIAVLVLEHVDGLPVHLALTETRRDGLDLIRATFDRLREIHAASPDGDRPLTPRDFEDHYVGKVLARYEGAKRLLPCLERPRLTVNGIEVENPYAVVRRRKREIMREVLDEAQPACMHGDPNLSNVIWGPNGAGPLFVDPRGAFGLRRTMRGDALYDAARLFYSLDGFCDLIEGRGTLLHCSERGVTFHADVHPRYRALAPRLAQLLADELGASPRSLRIRAALLYLSAVPLHAHSLQEMVALLERGVFSLAELGYC